jgi:alkanesulfonate monooxygenase SsuD/methylene tetrahydromethanopterin reductase-like flavin-dependent oxidoreductase (luciferase family)
MEFGIFDHLTRPAGVALDELYESRIRLLRRAEEAGITGYHVAEHHGHSLCMAPSQAVWLSAVARETQLLRVGTLVTCLPLHHPLRVAQEVCMLDQISRGRFDFGVGKGVSPFEHTIFEHDPAEAAARLDDAAAMIFRALATGRLTAEDSPFHDFPDVELSMAPVQAPCPPVWYPGNAEFAGRNGFTLVTPMVTAETRQRYLEAYEKGLDDPSRLSLRPDPPRIASVVVVVVAESDAAATPLAVRALTMLGALLGTSSGDRPPGPAGNPTEPRPAAHHAPPRGNPPGGGAVFGSPQTVREKLAAHIAEGNADYIMLAPAIGDLTPSEVDGSLGLFFDEVLPALQ